MNKQDLLVLIDKYTAGTASTEEMALLNRYYDSFQQANGWNEDELGKATEVEAKILERIQKIVAAERGEIPVPTNTEKEIYSAETVPPGFRPRALSYLRVAAAACIIALASLGALRLFKGDKKEIVNARRYTNIHENDIAPGSNKAVLKLANGSILLLDDARKETLPQQGTTKILKVEGKLAYQAEAGKVQEVLFNTVYTPRGGQYQVLLADGTAVWLNAESSLHFPTTFPGKERRVDITGEAYFEVAKKKNQPFIVSINGAEVKVSGTQFDVMGYTDESLLKTTLLEGSVRFINGESQQVLQPGQQSQLAKNGEIRVVNNIDVEEIMAWKNGFFYFDNADMQTVMRQVARWYDVEVVFRNTGTADLLHADIDKNSTLSEVLKALQIASGLRFKIEGKKIIVF